MIFLANVPTLRLQFHLSEMKPETWICFLGVCQNLPSHTLIVNKELEIVEFKTCVISLKVESWNFGISLETGRVVNYH
jgi:rRNA maturation protein Rpf1